MLSVFCVKRSRNYISEPGCDICISYANNWMSLLAKKR